MLDIQNIHNDISEITSEYDPSSDKKIKDRFHYVTEREYIDNINVDMYDKLLDTYTIKQGFYTESFGNFSFLHMRCAIYMQDIFIRIGAYDIGPSVLNTNHWIVIMSTLIIPGASKLQYTYYDIEIYFIEINMIKNYGWDKWVLMVKSCIEELEDRKGIY